MESSKKLIIVRPT